MDSDSKSSLVTSIIGSVIGSLIIYYFIVKPAIQLQQQMQKQQLMQEYTRLQQPVEQQPMGQYIQSSYKNNEKWAITRDADGFISNIEVIRDAKIGSM